MTHTDVFEDIVNLPDARGHTDFNRLVGLDEYKERLVKEVLLLVDPAALKEWSKKHHHGELRALDYLHSRPPLFILAGDVGTGKTALARTFGNEVTHRSKVQIQLHSLSLNARGSGAVGEMTRLISSAFRQVHDALAKTRAASGKAGRAIILLIDEADALAQSREAAQMHHEDRAGVNALIRGIDELASGRLPVAVIMCTNRLDAIDPAVHRRAAGVFEFKRPDQDQRRSVLETALHGSGLSAAEIDALVEATGETSSRRYGFTYSDLTQRLIPHLVIDAFPAKPITGDRALEIAQKLKPTPPFQSGKKPGENSHG